LNPLIVVSGIGTGGHYFPALVVAKTLMQRKRTVIFLVRRGGPEQRIARANGLATFPIPARGFYGKPVPAKIKSMISLFQALYRLCPLTKKAVGVAFGGFGSLPLIIACLINRRPFYLFEPNRIPGRATRFFADRARAVFLGLPLVRPVPGRTVITGIPIREEFKTAKEAVSAGNRKTVLIIGGSQGARRLNQLGIELQSVLPADYRIRIVSGERDFAWVDKSRNGRTRVIPFTHEPWEELQAASVIVSRAGALAGYEILAAGKKTIFIPYPFAVDNHQFYNAQYFAEIGAAELLEEKNLTKETVVTLIQRLAARKPTRLPGVILDAELRIADLVQSAFSPEAEGSYAR
jgi:UDP-N-acetylglucosamine--N-acetylmuramyl-(pentapeptide) pyrophosphoryl-undecaprenol N-acetylglucosamine transferase